jgi:hypothetical protein
MQLTPETVQHVWSHMAGKYGTVVVSKADAWTMKTVGAMLNLLGIQDRERFMTRYVTTIGRRIYTPFEVGVELGGWTLVGQIAVCAHEHTHVIQGRRDGWRYEWRYLTSTAWRAWYEVEAYRTTLEMQWALTGAIVDPERYAQGLEAYGCKAVDVEQARRTLTVCAEEVQRGIVRSEATWEALKAIAVG